MPNLDLLTGMKVIDMASFVAAPVCGKILAEYGADVIRIEALTGDDKTRDVGMRALNIYNGDMPIYDIVNGNKKQVAINTRNPKGLAIVKKMLKDADVFLCHMRDKDLKNLGLDWESLHKMNPKLVFANVNGYGTKGPYKNRGGFDMVAYVTRGGMSHAAFPDDVAPMQPFPGQGDIPTGTYLALGVIAAYVKAQRTGLGDHVSVPLYGAGMWHGVTPIISSQAPYNNKYPKTAADSFSPLNTSYKSGDGHWFMLCGNGWEIPWGKLVKLAGWDSELITKYPNGLVAWQHVGELIEMMNAWVATKTYAELDEIFTKCDIPHDICLTYREIVDDPVALEAGLLQELTYERSGTTVRVPRSPVYFKEAGLHGTEIAGTVGADTKDVLLSYGYTEEEISKLAKSKIIGLGDTWNGDYLIMKR